MLCVIKLPILISCDSIRQIFHAGGDFPYTWNYDYLLWLKTSFMQNEEWIVSAQLSGYLFGILMAEFVMGFYLQAILQLQLWTTSIESEYLCCIYAAEVFNYLKLTNVYSLVINFKCRFCWCLNNCSGCNLHQEFTRDSLLISTPIASTKIIKGKGLHLPWYQNIGSWKREKVYQTMRQEESNCCLDHVNPKKIFITELQEIWSYKIYPSNLCSI